MPSARYRKRPIEVDALQFTGENLAEVAEFLGYEAADGDTSACETVIIETLEGDMPALKGDWIIRGLAGECSSCSSADFHSIYVPVNP
jgi:hypothetical protein